MNRFESVPFRDPARVLYEKFLADFTKLGESIEALPDGRAKAIVLTKLEEAHMWVNKHLRDCQVRVST